MVDKGSVLAVDDTPASLKLLTDILRSEGYQVRSAISGELALHAAEAQTPELVLLDINMPGMSGFETCTRFRDQPGMREVPIIFVSALSETVEKVKGFELGAVDYVTKPYQREELLARVRTHLELSRLRNHLEAMVDERTRELRASEAKVRSSLFESITAIAATVEARDPYTAGHQRRVAEIAMKIASDLHLPEHQKEGLQLAASVHDIGKIKVPVEILNKPGRLNELEFALIEEHPQAGYEILKAIDFPWPVAEIVRQHHERLDGSGYPRGLRGEQILREAQILAVADVVDAMTYDRPYRAGLGPEKALEEITRKRTQFFAPDAVDVCVRLYREEHWSPQD